MKMREKSLLAGLVVLLALGTTAIAWSRGAPADPAPVLLGERGHFDAGTYTPRRIELPESAPGSAEGIVDPMHGHLREPPRLPALRTVAEWPDWPYRASCQSLSFSPDDVFAEVPEAGLGGSALDRALRRKVRLVGVHKGVHGWRLARRLPGRAAFVRGLPGAELESGHELEYMELVRERGRWDLEHYSQKCWPWTMRKGLGADPWLLAPDQPPLTPETRTVRVITGAHCSRREKPPVILGEPRFDQFGQRLVMTLWLRHRGGPGPHEACDFGLPAWPPIEVKLPEALGDRELFDGGEYPPRPASVYEKPREIGL
jgi:hypothetical protein